MNTKSHKVCFVFLLIGTWFLNACVDPNRAYSPDLKHVQPKLEYMPDMYRSPSYETYLVNPHFTDSMASRQPVTGTIPRDYHDIRYKTASGKDTSLFFSFHYPNTKEGYDSAGIFLKNPIPYSEDVLKRGKSLYDNFCTYCHGPNGNADGILVKNGKFPPPPSYTTGISSRGGNMRDLAPGKIYHSITYGVNLMGSHASQLSPQERWEIVYYIQSLQKTSAPADSTGQGKK